MCVAIVVVASNLSRKRQDALTCLHSNMSFRPVPVMSREINVTVKIDIQLMAAFLSHRKAFIRHVYDFMV